MHTSSEKIETFRDAEGEIVIVFDPAVMSQTPVPAWFDAAYWGDAAERIGSGGRGAAWFVDLDEQAMVLRRYLRGGWAAKFSRDHYLWRGEEAVRSVAEFRLLQRLAVLGLPVPMPLAAAYWRAGRRYRAAILIARISDVTSLGDRVLDDVASAPWVESGRLIARFHRVGLDHPDLNAHNVLFDKTGKGWLIDFDKAVMRDPAQHHWQRANLARLHRSLHKLGGPALTAAVDAGFIELRSAYDEAMSKETER